MKTYEERRIDKLQQRLKSRTRHDGTPRPGYKQNVATILAEIEQLTERNMVREENRRIIMERDVFPTGDLENGD